MSTNSTSEAYQRATHENYWFFRAFMHAGHSSQFVGNDWEAGGFSTNAEGDPVRDVKGNTVATFTSEPLDAANATHVAQCEEWFHG